MKGFILSLIAVISMNVQALTFELDNDPSILKVSGPFQSQDFDAFFDLLELDYMGIKTVVLESSPGGLVNEAYDMGRYIRKNGINTVITDGSRCSSACAMLWLSGTERTIEGSGVARFHAPYVPTEGVIAMIEDGTEDEQGNPTEWDMSQIIDGMRYMTREAIKVGVEWMFEMGSESSWIIGMMDNGPVTMYEIRKGDL